jgi:nicotinamidase-related amidase
MLGLLFWTIGCEPMQRGNAGWALHAALDVRAEDLKVEKTASDAFYETNLDDLLRSRKVDHLYISGLQSEFCVDASCKSALSKDYRVTLISDAHTTGDADLSAQQIIDHHNYALANLAHPKNQIMLSLSSEV